MRSLGSLWVIRRCERTGGRHRLVLCCFAMMDLGWSCEADDVMLGFGVAGIRYLFAFCTRLFGNKAGGWLCCTKDAPHIALEIAIITTSVLYHKSLATFLHQVIA